MAVAVIVLGWWFVSIKEVAAASFRIAYWKLEEASPSYEDSDNNHDGVCAGQCPVSTSDGKINNGQVFDGNNTGIDIAASDAFNWDANHSFSVELWMKGDPGQSCATADEVMIGRIDNTTNLHWALECVQTTGEARFYLRDTDGPGFALQSTRVITDGAWHHIVGGRDALNNINYLYVDGIDVITATHTYSGNFSSATADLTLGYLESGTHFQGTLDEVAIYSGMLSAREIGTHYYLARDYSYAETCTTVTIMPLGDSITRGSGTSPVTGYRQPLYLSLTDAEYLVDFVGGLSNGDTATPSFDTDHEGHSGIQDDDVRDNVYSWLNANPAEVVLLHIGTNDMDADTLDFGAADVESILDNIDQYSEDITVVLARIINRKTYNSDTHQFNDDVAAMAADRIAGGDKIIIVDQESALTYPDDMFDDEHPNSSGYSKMAAVWLDALNDFLPVCMAPTITSTPVTTATAGISYYYDVESTDSDFAPLYTLTTHPDGMTIDEETGEISWIPPQTGTVTVTVTADNVAGTDSQTFAIDVSGYPLFTNTQGNGTVSVQPLKGEYAYGEAVTLTATADPGWYFVDWSGDLNSTTNPATLEISTTNEVTATFSNAFYNILTGTVGNGHISIEPTKAHYTHGELITLTAESDPGWTFASWGGDLSGSANPITATVTSDRAITATFVLEQYTLSLNTIGNGTVEVKPEQEFYTYGMAITLTATADPGWYFQGWNVTSSNSPTIPFTVTKSEIITATFEKSYHLFMPILLSQ